MRGLTSADVLAIWDRGHHESAARRALLLFAADADETTLQSLARLPLGERDARLLTLRELTFGRRLSCRAICPACGEQLQADCDTDDLRVRDQPRALSREINHEGIVAQLRLPDSLDLEAVSRAPDLASARRELIARALSDVRGADGKPWPTDDLPESLVAAAAARLAEADPQADIELALQCPACRHGWSEPFDIAGYFWIEVRALARQLLSEVHELAAAYGWRESEILALPPARRAAYLEQVRG